MEFTTELPNWLDGYRLDDTLRANAYESTPPELRALLKTALAFTFHRWPSQDRVQKWTISSSRSGFRHMGGLRPAAWVLVCTGPGYASPARFLAATAPAIAAGVGRMAIVSEKIFPTALCTAMELAGLEDSFVVGKNHIPALYEDLRSISHDGRVLLFPGADGKLTPVQKTLLHSAARDGIPLLRDLPAPRLLHLYTAKPEIEKLARRLRWLHPDAEILTEPTADMRVVFVPHEETSVPESPAMVLGPGMEACWPGPNPDFFHTSKCSAFLFRENFA